MCDITYTNNSVRCSAEQQLLNSPIVAIPLSTFLLLVTWYNMLKLSSFQLFFFKNKLSLNLRRDAACEL